MNTKEEIKKVKELGEKIGYGWLMSLASSLWRREDKRAMIPTTQDNASRSDMEKVKRVDQIIKDNL